jgi:hypothetical protein
MKKAILLAMVAAIVAMFAVPGSASAAWTKHHKAITENVNLEFTGTEISFTNAGLGGGYDCKTISKVHFTQGTTTGAITTFEVEGNATEKSICKGFGSQQQCEVHKFTAHGLPWTIHTLGKNASGEGTVSITTGTITTQNTGFLCTSPDLTPGTVHISVAAAEINTTSTGKLTGSLTSDPGGAVAIGGTIHVLGTITYGV